MTPVSKRIFSWLGGLFRKSTNQEYIGDNDLANVSNFEVAIDGHLDKRAGRSKKLTLDTAIDYPVTGLIQNTLLDGTREEFAVANGYIYKNVDGTAVGQISGFAEGQFHAEAWNGKVYWGQGEDNIITRNRTSVPRFYVSDTGNTKVHLITGVDFTLSSSYTATHAGDNLFGIATDDNLYIVNTTDKKVEVRNRLDFSLVAYIGNSTIFTQPTGIAVDSTRVYVTDYTKYQLIVFDKNGYSVVKTIGTLTGAYAVAQDANYIYVSCRNGDSIKIISKDDYSIVQTINVTGPGMPNQPLGICVNDEYIFLSVLSDQTVRWYSKTDYTQKGSSTFTSPNGLAVDNDYLYVSQGNTDILKVIDVKSMTSVATLDATTLGIGGFIPGSVSTGGESVLDYYAPLTAPGRVTVARSGNGNLMGYYRYSASYSGLSGSILLDRDTIYSFEKEIYVQTSGKVSIALTDEDIADNVLSWHIFRKHKGTDGTYDNLQEVTYLPIATTTYTDNTVNLPSANPYVMEKSTLYPFLDSKIFTFFQNKLWVFKSRTGYYSYPYKPYYFPATYYMEFSTREDVTGAKQLGANLVVFTANEIYSMAGWSVDNYISTRISNGTGTISHRSIQEYGGMLMFLDDDGIWATDGAAAPLKVSKPKLDEVIETIQRNKAHLVCSAVYKDKYYLSVPTDSTKDYNDKVIVYDFINKCWYILEDLNVASFALIKNSSDELELWAGDNKSGVYQLFVGSADADKAGNDHAITCSMETKHYDMGEPFLKKTFQWLKTSLGNNGVNPVTATITYAIGDSKEEVATIKVDATRTVSRIRPNSAWGKSAYYKISESSRYPFSVFGVEFIFRMINEEMSSFD